MVTTDAAAASASVAGNSWSAADGSSSDHSSSYLLSQMGKRRSGSKHCPSIYLLCVSRLLFTSALVGVWSRIAMR